jgi:hypothetical protein
VEEFGDKDQLRKKEEQLRELLFFKEKCRLMVANDMDVDIPPFDPVLFRSRKLPLFPFFDPVIEEYLDFLGEDALVARDDNIQQVNDCISKRNMDKYRAIICSTSRGMGKTAFMEAVGLQAVKQELKNKLMMDALSYGRILSFDFASAAARTAVDTVENPETFFPRLMIYFLCRMFDGTEVDGIHFEEVAFMNITHFSGTQANFNTWKNKCVQSSADRMMDAYIRLTNLAFQVNCSSPPVFLLDEIQGLCKGTNVQSTFKEDQVIYHSFLTLLLTQIAGKHKPVCICTGTNSGRIIKITEKSRIIPQFVSLATLHKEEDYKAFWNQRTKYKNAISRQNAHYTDEDEDMFNSLVCASYQIPRLLLLAHNAWFQHKTTSYVTDRIAVLPTYENDATHYYSEMAELLFNESFTPSDIAHILMCCGVRWEVGDINSKVPGTQILWSSLISMSIVFPYLDNCYIIPFGLIWTTRTPGTRVEGDYKKTKAGIKEACKSLISNFDIANLYVSYDKLRQLSLYNLGMCYETLFASSLAVKYYLRKLITGEKYIPLLHVYDIRGEDEISEESLSQISVDFSLGMAIPEKECFVDSLNLPSAVIHNRKTTSAHHDIILPTKKSTNAINIPVSCKASFSLSNDKTISSQKKISKKKIRLWIC